jgi:hypothetical protein
MNFWCLFFILSFSHLLTCIYTIWTTFPTPHLVLRFCWRENIKDNKKDIVFLLVWDKYSYTEKFLALLPCTCVLQLTMVHFYQPERLLAIFSCSYCDFFSGFWSRFYCPYKTISRNLPVFYSLEELIKTFAHLI